MATQREKQIAYEGGVTYYKADGTEGSESDYAVKLTKTVKPTGTENRFTINLEVETRQNIEELQMAPDAAVVLVYDCSGSMGVYDTKAARDASARFLETYVEGAGDAQRKVALVQFGTTAQTILNWPEKPCRMLLWRVWITLKIVLLIMPVMNRENINVKIH